MYVRRIGSVEVVEVRFGSWMTRFVILVRFGAFNYWVFKSLSRQSLLCKRLGKCFSAHYVLFPWLTYLTCTLTYQ